MNFPSCSMGSARTALFQEVMEPSTGVPCPWKGTFMKGRQLLGQSVSAVTLCCLSSYSLLRDCSITLSSTCQVSVCLLLRQVMPNLSSLIGASTWPRYDNRMEAMLGLGAAGVVESLLRTAVRMPSQADDSVVILAQVRRSAGGLACSPLTGCS